jgi:hypothetical protein
MTTIISQSINNLTMQDLMKLHEQQIKRKGWMKKYQKSKKGKKATQDASRKYRRKKKLEKDKIKAIKIIIKFLKSKL